MLKLGDQVILFQHNVHNFLSTFKYHPIIKKMFLLFLCLPYSIYTNMNYDNFFICILNDTGPLKWSPNDYLGYVDQDNV